MLIDENQILFFGDTHGDFDHVSDLVHTYRPEAIIFTGDLAPKMQLHLMLGRLETISQVWYVHGNHDADSEYQESLIFNSLWSCRNLNGKVITLPSGISIAGVGGVFRGEIWMPPETPNYYSWTAYEKAKHKLSNFKQKQRRHRTSIFPNIINKLNTLKADILVTHEAPCQHKMGFKCLTALANNLNVKYWCHGHHHTYETYDYTNMKVFGAPYRGVVNLNGQLIYEK